VRRSSLSQTRRLLVYDGSFFKLRREIDSLMNNEHPPRLVVYVPNDRSKTHLALSELEAAGIVMQPGQQPPNPQHAVGYCCSKRPTARSG
jgi:hypothetical protein